MNNRYGVGTRVAFHLVFRARRYGVIESVSVDTDAPRPYRIRWEDGADLFTDLRGSNWYIGAEAERLAAGDGIWPECAGLVGAGA